MSKFNIVKKDIDNLYNSKTDGILHIKKKVFNFVSQEQIREWYVENKKNFTEKREKYIENNQKVSLVFNDNIDNLDLLKDNTENILHKLYLELRSDIEKLSEAGFIDGDRLETKLIEYPLSNLGVGAHKDLSSNINCIVLFNLIGSTFFYTSDDKEFNNEKKYFVEPGDLIVIRGPRNKNENHLRPIHYVKDIKEYRLVFVCREIDDKTEKKINKDNWRGF